MDIETVKALSAVLNEAGLTALEIAEGDMRIRLEKSAPAAAPPPAVPAVGAPAGMDDVPGMPAEETPVDFNRIKEIRSPMVGVFYAAPAPDQPPFVSVGTKVRKGDVLCIVEAMKVMNEILAEEDGEIVDICVSNGDIVEFSQTLFKLC